MSSDLPFYSFLHNTFHLSTSKITTALPLSASFITIDLSDFNRNKACRSLRHKLTLACLFVSSELLFNVLIDYSKYLSVAVLGDQSDLFLTNDPPISSSSSSSFPLNI